MSPRSIRRAARRQAIKDARVAANRANAQLSTGPCTQEGRAKSCLNSVKTALTGRTVLLPTDDVEAYRRHVQNYVDEFQPVGPHESELVQALADHSWRLDRIATLEMTIYAYGYEQFAEQFADRGELQGSFAQMHAFLHYEKQLRNLQIREMRIRRNREKDAAELRQLQRERSAKERIEKERLDKERIDKQQKTQRPASTSPRVGFVFSPVEWIPASETLPSPITPEVDSQTEAAA